MPNYKKYDYSQKIFLPISLEEQLVPGTLEFAIHTLVENRLDMSVFDQNYKNDDIGRSAYDPKILLKVVLLGYSRGLISSRQLERACNENVLFIALSCDQHPDHSTIAAFVSSMKDQIIPIFSDILLVCEQENLLGGTFFALDGCKLPSNASLEWSGKIKDLKKRKEKIERKVQALLEEQVETDKKEAAVLKEITTNRQKQIEKLKRQADRIEKWLGGHDKKMGLHGKKEIQSNITDNDSAKMQTSHGTIQGYNGQALVDAKHQVIVHGEAVGRGQDADNIPPMVDGAKKNLEKAGKPKNYFKGKVLTADSNYHSVTNIQKCEKEGLDAYIPDNKFRIRDKRFSSQDRFRPKSKKYSYFDFKHDVRKDQYICPNGKVLKRFTKRKLMGKFNITYVSNEADCKACQLRSKCLSNENTKRRFFSYFIDESNRNISKEMVKKVESEIGKKIYPQRVAIVEPVFANIRTQKRLDRFTLRGKIKVNIQWMLYCMIHNIEKVVNYGYGFT